MSNTIELVLIPAPGMGHIPSAVELAKLVIQRNDRICISILIFNLPSPSNKTNAYVESQLRNNPNPTRLTFITLPPLPSLDLSDPIKPYSFPTIIELYKPVVRQVLDDRVRAGFPNPVGFVLDFFCASMMDVADELHVASYMFFTSGVSLLNLILYAQSLADHRGVDVATEFSDREFLVVPGFKNPVTTKVIPAAFQAKELRNHKMVHTRARKFRRMKGILINTYTELESFAIQALMNGKGRDEKVPPVYPVGPILELEKKNGGEFDGDRDSVMKWLDGQAKSSVVFLCFGSMGSFDDEQVKEIANGLDKSGYQFLWALRKPCLTLSNEAFEEALPKGFLERIANRGKIVEWAPQVEVLAHPAIGGFVSHCGWNSLLESLWFGVPVATWPMYAEQQLNAFELVKELQLAVEIRMDYRMDMNTGNGNFLVTAEEIDKGLRKLMSMDDNMRKKIKNMSEKGRFALEEGGSSYYWLGRFIEDVLSISELKRV